MSPKRAFQPINPPPTEEEKNARRYKKYTLHDYADAFPPNSSSLVPSYSSPYGPSNSSSNIPSQYVPLPYIPLSVFSTDLRPPPQLGVTSATDGDGTVTPGDKRPPPQPRVTSVTDGDGTVPPGDNATQQNSLDKSQHDDVETPCLSPVQSTASQKQPVQPSPRPASNIYGEVPAIKAAILSLAQVVHPTHLCVPGAYLNVVTGRSANGQQVTAALIVVHPTAGRWTKLAGGEQYFETYCEAMVHVLALLEQQISSGLAAAATQR